MSKRKSDVIDATPIERRLTVTQDSVSNMRADDIQNQINYDGWINVFTNLNVMGKDKRTGGIIRPHVLMETELEALYQADDIASKIVDIVPEEMMREGFKIIVPDDKNNIPENMQALWDQFDTSKKFLTSMKWARLYGGGAILVGLDDGMDPSEPVDFKKIRKIDFITVLDRFRIFPTGIINYDVTSSNFGLPDFYRVYTMQTVLPLIHHSRIIRFEGIEVPWRLRAFFNYWGDSVFTKIYKIIRDFQAVHDSAALIVTDFTQFIFKLKNLTQLLAQGQKGDQTLLKRLSLLSATSSIVNAIVVSDDEEVERKSTTVTGLADLIQETNNRLVSATEIPHTKLLGESPSGLGATGDSEKRDWYDTIKTKQKGYLQPLVLKMLKFYFASKAGPTGGKIPPRFAIEFPPLWQMTEMDQAKLRQTQAMTDQIYIQNQVVESEDIAVSRFGSGQYSPETQINMKERNAIEESIAEAQAETEGPPNDKDGWALGQQIDPSTVIIEPAPKLKNYNNVENPSARGNKKTKAKGKKVT